MKTLSEKETKSNIIINDQPTLGEIAASDVRKAEVLKKYGFDFCCGGKQTLRQACKELNIDAAQVRKELYDIPQQQSRSNSFDFNRWEPDFLADYIYNEHHKYYYDEAPLIAGLMEKVVNHHATSHPFLQNLSALYSTLQNELSAHFFKEERVLFPLIKQLVDARRQNIVLQQNDIINLAAPLKAMEADHEAAGGLLAQIRSITTNYTLPANACNSFKLLYDKLIALEEDLHQHIHLENNILFAKALLLEKELLNINR